MITVGLDFGTHQSKVCIENKKGVELSYEFFQFTDCKGVKQYTLPSVIRLGYDSKLEYGYLSEDRSGKIIRYFKQATFCTNTSSNLTQKEAKLYSIWYLAFIIFDLEEIFGTEFVIQMGAPTDTANLDKAKITAVELLVAAYRLVENVYMNDKAKFMNASYDELVRVTPIEPYDKGTKEEYGILVFPEAYACLMPLVKSSKIASGMSLMIDIGGGTTDISFFTIEDGGPQVYAFYSIDKGLNYLTEAERRIKKELDSNIRSESDISNNRRRVFRESVNNTCNDLIDRLKKHFSFQTQLQMNRLMDALKTRPVIYTGGGSTFSSLREKYAGFKDIIHISEKDWRTKAVKDLDHIKQKGLCPILSTAYGLSISVADDLITCYPLPDIFRNIRGLMEENSKSYQYGTAISESGFNYGDDYSAWK